MTSRIMSRGYARLAVASLAATTLATLTVTGAATAGAAPAAAPQVVAHTTSGNPLAGPWGIYKATTLDNPTYRAYARSSGANKQLLARTALRPRVQWFGAWIENSRIEAVITKYIADIKSHDRNAISMMAMFPIKNWEAQPQSARTWSSAYIAQYKDWINRAAKAIGSNRAMIVEQPDFIYATKNNNTRIPLSMVRYAVQKFASLPHTTVYIDAGSRDYRTVKGVSLVSALKAAGIGYARGFSLNDTHHDATNLEIGYGQTVARALAKAKLPYHFVVNTSSNGTPSTGGQLSTDKDAPACANRKQKLCLALGIPPTYHTSASYWGITSANKAIAARLVDGYVWVDRPWLFDQDGNQSAPVSRQLNLGKATPYIAYIAKSPTSVTSYGRVAKGKIARKTFYVHNLSKSQNLTVDGIAFSSATGSRWSYSTFSTCHTGTIVAPGKSCKAVIAYTSARSGSATLKIVTNTANLWTRRVKATA